jgi:CheY-like chemotaxis protein
MINQFNLLVIDDLQDHRKLMQQLLNHKGFKTYIAQSGVAAIKTFQQRKYSGILADMHMPKMDGVETIRKIREFDRLVPVVAITAFDMDDYKPRAEDLNITEWVHKPITEKKLNRIGNIFYENIISVQKKQLLEQLAGEIKVYLKDYFPDIITLIQNNPKVAMLIRDVFAREVPEMRSCIDLLMTSEFKSTAAEYKNIHMKLAELTNTFDI